MKIIDLLNKIANGEEVPKEIKIKMSGGRVAPFYKQNYDYINNYTGQTLLECLHEFNLNDEIEITEEEKEIEKLRIQRTWQDEFRNEPLLRYIYKEDMKDIENKINELIDEVNKLKEK